jgi:hypothetical protein
MRPIDYFSESFDSLRKQKMCALLTMLDISVGVFTVMVTLGIEQLGIHPKRTVRFIAWMDGEQGAEGVLTYAKEHAKDLLITSRLSNPIRARDILSVFTLWANRTSRKGCARSPRFLSPSEQAL